MVWVRYGHRSVTRHEDSRTVGPSVVHHRRCVVLKKVHPFGELKKGTGASIPTLEHNHVQIAHGFGR